MPSYSALQIVTTALQNMGVAAPNETLTDADAELGFAALNDLLDGWSNEYIFFYTLNPVSVVIGSGVASFTIGPNGATVSFQRPKQVDYGPAAASFTVGLSVNPVNVVSAVEWNAIQGGLSISSGVPDTLFYNPEYPLGQINLSPATSVGGLLTFNPWVPLSAFASLSAIYNMAFGAAEALQWNLCIKLQPYYSQAQISPLIIAKALEAKKALMISNSTSRAMMRRYRSSANVVGP